MIGYVWDDVYDAATDATDWVEGAVESGFEWVSDAGGEIAGVLRFVAPIVALFPGIGTGLSVAMTAAAAYASGDAIEDAIVDIAASAIPGVVPRAIFRAAAQVSRDAISGRNVVQSVIGAGREVAGAAGGESAQAAFDTGVRVARGEEVGSSSLDALRAQFRQQSPAALAAFDGGRSIARGESFPDAAIAAGRAYIGAAGGNTALAAFDMGFAIARGKSLQEAGFAGLRAFASGNDVAERAVNFADAMIRAADEGRDVEDVLREELGSAFAQYGVAGRVALAGVLEQWRPQFLDTGSFELARYFDVDEIVARAAQAIMRKGASVPDEALREQLTRMGVETAVDKYGARAVASRDINSSYLEVRDTIREEQLLTAIRIDDDALKWGTAKYGPTRAPYVGPVLTRVVPEGVAVTAAPSSGRSTAGQDVLLGVTVAGALAALYWWARHGKAA